MPNLVSHLVYTVAPGFAPPLVPFAPPLTVAPGLSVGPPNSIWSRTWFIPSHLLSHLLSHLVYTVAPPLAPGLAPGFSVAPPLAPGLAPGLYCRTSSRTWFIRRTCSRTWFRTSPDNWFLPSHLVSHLLGGRPQGTGGLRHVRTSMEMVNKSSSANLGIRIMKTSVSRLVEMRKIKVAVLRPYRAHPRAGHAPDELWNHLRPSPRPVSREHDQRPGPP
ncbi:hypothetical protein FPV67DRAFT_1457007 [Lyophyllum atratum]|nr:hypothetical protein FPV67DRAFT_1457007 [Lyophyllum atratum]